MPVPAFVKDRIRGSLWGGAMGDSFGAPVEMMSRDVIFALCGDDGVTTQLEYPPKDVEGFMAGDQTGIGIVTDDTCMTMATLAGLMHAQKWGYRSPIESIFKAYLRWAVHQRDKGGGRIANAFANIAYPQWFYDFCFQSGAGRGTISALATGNFGTVDKPISFDAKSGGRIVNSGCGGLMRIAPVGWYASMAVVRDAYAMGRDVAAITHGDPIANITSGVVAELIKWLCLGWTWDAAVSHVSRKLAYRPELCDENDPQSYVMWGLLTPATSRGANIAHFSNRDLACMLDEIPREIRAISQGIDSDDPAYNQIKIDRFSAETVFLQAIMICQIAQKIEGTPSDRLKRALTLAVSHSGDSDSVAAIVGNILGAQFGALAIEDMKRDFSIQKVTAIDAAADGIDDAFDRFRNERQPVWSASCS